VIVNVINQQSALSISTDQVQKIVKEVIRAESQRCDEVDLYFVDTPTICQLHADFFQDDSPTDCISFPLDDESEASPYRLLGDVFVCPATAVAYAKKHHLNPYDETLLYIVHGLLHLMGYDDLNNQDRREMRKAEARHIQNLQLHHIQLYAE
jgi:probable rRNA maturation factor